jgi:hypothetical protein
MINPIEVYEDAGRKAGQASKQKDIARAQSWATWLSRAITIETIADRTAAIKAYQEAYKEASRVYDPPSYFR